MRNVLSEHRALNINDVLIQSLVIGYIVIHVFEVQPHGFGNVVKKLFWQDNKLLCAINEGSVEVVVEVNACVPILYVVDLKPECSRYRRQIRVPVNAIAIFCISCLKLSRVVASNNDFLVLLISSPVDSDNLLANNPSSL